LSTANSFFFTSQKLSALHIRHQTNFLYCLIYYTDNLLQSLVIEYCSTISINHFIFSLFYKIKNLCDKVITVMKRET